MTNMELVNAYTDYQLAREALKQRDKQTLESRLAQERARLARAIQTERKESGVSITDIQELLGTGNRNFLYDVVRESYGTTKLPKTAKAVTTSGVSGTGVSDIEKSDDPTAGWAYEIDLVDNFVAIVTDSDYCIEYDFDLDVSGSHPVIKEIPEAWYDTDLSPEERAFYKRIVQEIESS